MTLRDSKWGATDSIDVCHRVRGQFKFLSLYGLFLGGGVYGFNNINAYDIDRNKITLGNVIE